MTFEIPQNPSRTSTYIVLVGMFVDNLMEIDQVI